MAEIKRDIEEPYVIEGDILVDDRGEVGYVNDFHFKGVKRFYTVTNHKAGFVRAWHGHRKEGKYVTVTSGSAIIGVVKIDNWEKPSKNNKIFRYILTAKKPSVLYIPPGHANGFKSLVENAVLVFFSTSTIDESKNDDIRFDPRYWDIWDIPER